MIRFHSLTESPLQFREEDEWGSGAFGAPRGERQHRGVDIVALPGTPVLSPMDGEVVREASPYEDDPRFSGLLIRGRQAWADYELKLFYVEGPTSGTVSAGDPIGQTQDLGMKYPGITNHVHVEVRHNGELIDGTDLFEHED